MKKMSLIMSILVFICANHALHATDLSSTPVAQVQKFLFKQKSVLMRPIYTIDSHIAEGKQIFTLNENGIISLQIIGEFIEKKYLKNQKLSDDEKRKVKQLFTTFLESFELNPYVN